MFCHHTPTASVYSQREPEMVGYGFTDLPPSLPLLSVTLQTRIYESSYRRRAIGLLECSVAWLAQTCKHFRKFSAESVQCAECKNKSGSALVSKIRCVRINRV